MPLTRLTIYSCALLTVFSKEVRDNVSLIALMSSMSPSTSSSLRGRCSTKSAPTASETSALLQSSVCFSFSQVRGYKISNTAVSRVLRLPFKSILWMCSFHCCFISFTSSSEYIFLTLGGGGGAQKKPQWWKLHKKNTVPSFFLLKIAWNTRLSRKLS